MRDLAREVPIQGWSMISSATAGPAGQRQARHRAKTWTLTSVRRQAVCRTFWRSVGPRRTTWDLWFDADDPLRLLFGENADLLAPGAFDLNMDLVASDS